MRLDKITIGSAKDSPTHGFKNLKNVTVDFDQKHWITVVIGWNGTGKSNVLEALAIIFRDLIQGSEKTSKAVRPAFAFKLSYRMGSGDETLHINIDADPDRGRESLIIHVATDAEARGVGTLTPYIEGEPETSPLRGKKISRAFKPIRNAILGWIALGLEHAGVPFKQSGSPRYLDVSGYGRISAHVAKCQILASGNSRWSVRHLREKCTDYNIIARMNVHNTHILDYYVLNRNYISCQGFFISAQSEYRFTDAQCTDLSGFIPMLLSESERRPAADHDY